MALSRYKMYRGPRPKDDPLSNGIRQDTRHRTRHCLRPEQKIVEAFFKTSAENKDRAWKTFEQKYLRLLELRFGGDRGPFDALAKLATEKDVYIGCSCPTKKNPDVSRCHTIPALRFMKQAYPKLTVRFPDGVDA